MTAKILERKPQPFPPRAPAHGAPPVANGVGSAAPILWHHLPVEEVLPRLAVELRAGLSAAEVRTRQAQHGPNRLTAQKRKSELIRFRFQEKGIRMAHLGDPVVDKRGRVVGKVTSCAVDMDGYLTGQAYIESKAADRGNILFIYQGAPKDESKILGALNVGERVIVPSPAHVVRRFPKTK